MELVPPALLKPNSTNARTHSERQIRQIAASIEKFGFLVPIIIDEDNKIAAGHGRWQASTALGLSLVPIIRARFLILAAQNNVSDARMEYLIRDRLSWLRFLGFDLGAATPDANTIRLFPGEADRGWCA